MGEQLFLKSRKIQQFKSPPGQKPLFSFLTYYVANRVRLVGPSLSFFLFSRWPLNDPTNCLLAQNKMWVRNKVCIECVLNIFICFLDVITTTKIPLCHCTT